MPNEDPAAAIAQISIRSSRTLSTAEFASLVGTIAQLLDIDTTVEGTSITYPSGVDEADQPLLAAVEALVQARFDRG